MDAEKQAVTARLVEELEKVRALRGLAQANPKTMAARQGLRQWQASRLARTHADLLASPRTGAAAAFFLSDLYGPQDFSERDEEISRLVPLMARMLPLAGLVTVTSAIELDALSERLDAAMVLALRKRYKDLVGLDAAGYAEAYRSVGDRPARLRQIELIRATGEALDQLTRKSMITVALRMMREPAHLAGFGALQEFLERGFVAFRDMGGAGEFVAAICSRETQLLEDLFAGRPSALG